LSDDPFILFIFLLVTSVFLSVQNGLYPSNGRVDGCLDKTVVVKRQAGYWDGQLPIKWTISSKSRVHHEWLPQPQLAVKQIQRTSIIKEITQMILVY